MFMFGRFCKKNMLNTWAHKAHNLSDVLFRKFSLYILYSQIYDFVNFVSKKIQGVFFGVKKNVSVIFFLISIFVPDYINLNRSIFIHRIFPTIQ